MCMSVRDACIHACMPVKETHVYVCISVRDTHVCMSVRDIRTYVIYVVLTDYFSLQDFTRASTQGIPLYFLLRCNIL